MASSAQKKLQKASFRGVPFEVSSADMSVGRRVSVFEYPQRDTPFTEDLGKSARTYTVNAFVTGKDYIQKMNKLIEALEKEGSGELVHPWLGKKDVTPKSTSTVKYTSKLLVANVSITFVETGELQNPTKAADTGFKSKSCANILSAEGMRSLAENLNMQNVQDYVKAEVTGSLQSMLGFDVIDTISAAFELSDAVSEFASDAINFVSGGPTQFANKLAGTLGLGGYATTVNSWRKVIRQVKQLTESDWFNSSDSEKHDSTTTAYQSAKATEEIQKAIRLIEISNAVGASANVGTELDRINTSEPVSVMAYDEMLEVRNAVLSMIDAEMLKTTDDAVYAALEGARAAVWEDMTTRAESMARIVTVTPTEVKPALVIAYDFYGDATRELEIVGRNNIRRSGFTPAAPLKLLSE